MIEAAPKTVNPVVAGPAVSPKLLCMLLHKGWIDLSMANLTHHRIETGKIGAVAIFAGKSRAIFHLQVSCQ